MDLYYYTTAETMRFILTKGDIFASNIGYLNDSEEYVNGLKELRNILCDDKVAKKYAESAKSRLQENRAYQSALQEADKIYSISFSKEKDLLSQWYMYSKESGVRLKMHISDDSSVVEWEFKVHSKDKTIGEKPDLVLPSEFKPVHYFTRIGMEQTVYEEEAEKIIEGVNEYVENKSLKDFDTYITTIWSGYAPYIKNYEFRQEKEVRLVFRSLPVSGQLPLVQYRNARGVLIPYLDIYLDEGWPITEIMVGPGRNQNSVYTSICHFIENERAIKRYPIKTEGSIYEYVNGLREYQISECECVQIIGEIQNECSKSSAYKDVLYEVLNRYMNEEKGNKSLIQEYMGRNTYTSKDILVRKSNVPYEF